MGVVGICVLVEGQLLSQTLGQEVWVELWGEWWIEWWGDLRGVKWREAENGREQSTDDRGFS